jgi:protein TonB
MLGTPERENGRRRSRTRVVVSSAALHGLLIAALLYHGTTDVAPMRLPGSLHGSNLTLTYVPGRAAAAAVVPAKKAVARLNKPKLLFTAPAAAVAGHAAEPSPNPDSSQGNDGLGEGDITIALMQFFPDPKPDLSQLPSGTRGDVILYAVIGADGRIEHLTLTKGLGHGVDQSVIATVEQWTFHPAMRNGKPVSSEQEFHFHYERS